MIKLKKLICYLSRQLLSRQLESFKQGRHSIIYGWRVKGSRKVKFSIGIDTIVNANVVFEKDGAEMNIGDRTFIGKSLLTIAEKLTIGDNVMISWGVTVTDHDSHSLQFSKRAHDVENWADGKKSWDDVNTQAVVVHDKAWVGFNAVILKGITIGEGSIVGAASVVTKDVLPWTIVAGNPAKLIREIPEDER